MSGTKKNQETFSQEQEELLLRLLEEEGLAAPQEQTILPREEHTAVPLSFSQQRLWFLDQLEPGQSSYNIPAAFQLNGPLHVRTLKRSLQALVQRHESLRTTFTLVDEQAVQTIHPHAVAHLPVIDLQALLPEAREAEKVRLIAIEGQEPFDLTCGPLLRSALLRLGVEEHVFLLTMHHIISDAWSLGIFATELTTLYAALLRDQPSPLPELAIQYADFTLWQRDLLQKDSDREQQEVAYWKQQLEGAPEYLALPTDKPRPAIQTVRGASLPISLPIDMVKRLNRLG